MYSFKFEDKRPDLIRKMVAIDVGGAMKPGPCAGLFIVSYQMWLLLAFVLGKPVGDFMSTSLARLFGAPSARRIAKASSCYPYYHVWKQVCSGGAPPDMMTTSPLLFIHGCSGVKKIVVSETET